VLSLLLVLPEQVMLADLSVIILSSASLACAELATLVV
jgi:hypothetical protein